ncbi:C-reactive protein-like [Actinia tenebrosa]|uniref:C-reactive protein-like n=1 Tax=Actinia tenebrosa TaxID=6105 RepID=A0A6P8HIZ9_ACTTE|nr:C-reactive protein-like [Actinia tenebrosa]
MQDKPLHSAADSISLGSSVGASLDIQVCFSVLQIRRDKSKLLRMEILVPVILLSLWKHGHAQSCKATAYSQFYHKIQGHVIKTYSAVTTSLQCTEKCGLHADRYSINYCFSQGICELNNANHLTNPESLVYSAGCHYLNHILRAVPICSNKLCSYPLVCKVDNNEQSHKCVLCEDVKEVLLFPRKSVEDKVEHELQADVQLTAFTISMWVQADPNTDNLTPFGYATVSQPNEISVYLTKGYTELGITNTFETGYPSAIDGKWHHLCATWQNLDGTYKFYIDGVKKLGVKTSMHQGHVIQKGALLLGQEQDSYKGGFQASQSFQGNLSSVNMWDRVLNAQEVSALAKKCPNEFEEGNFIGWSTLKTKKSSGVKLWTCSNQCS